MRYQWNKDSTRLGAHFEDLSQDGCHSFTFLSLYASDYRHPEAYTMDYHDNAPDLVTRLRNQFQAKDARMD